MSVECDGLQCLISLYCQANDVATKEERNAIINVLKCIVRLNNLKATDHEPLGNSVIDSAQENLAQQSSVIDVLKIFYNEGAPIDSKSDVARAVLNLAIQHGMFKVIAFLIDRGADLNIDCLDSSDSYSETVMHMVLDRYNEAGDEQRQEYGELIHTLICKGVDVHKANENGVSPLNVAIKHRLLTVLEIFAHFTVDFSRSDEKGNLLHFLCNSEFDSKTYHMEFRVVQPSDYNSCMHGLLVSDEPSNDTSFNEVIDFLVSHGCDVDLKNKKGATPLHYAIEEHKNGVARRLIMNGADVNQKRDTFIIKLDYPNRNRMQEQITPLHQAVVSNNVGIIEALVEAGADINAGTTMGRGVLHLLRCSDDAEVVRMLLKMGAHFDIRDKSGLLPLEAAFLRYYFDVIKELFKAGADINDSAEFIFQNISYLQGCQRKMYLFITNHLLKLQAAGLPVCKNLELYALNYQFCDKTGYAGWLQEVEALKYFMINKTTSLYDFLHMNPNYQCAYVENTELLNLVNSTNLEAQFPAYHVLVKGCFNRTVRRREMLHLAKTTWYKLIKAYLPDICVYHILSYLSNIDLRSFIEGA